MLWCVVARDDTLVVVATQQIPSNVVRVAELGVFRDNDPSIFNLKRFRTQVSNECAYQKLQNERKRGVSLKVATFHLFLVVPVEYHNETPKGTFRDRLSQHPEAVALTLEQLNEHTHLFQ